MGTKKSCRSVLKRVSERLGYSLGYVKMVSAGRFYNKVILDAIAEEKEREAREIRNREK